MSYNGAVYCSGYNGYGQLEMVLKPTGTKWFNRFYHRQTLQFKRCRISSHLCTIRKWDLRCWGRNHYGQIGVKSDTPNVYKYPTTVLDLPVNPMSFDLGYEYTCALLETQTSMCWGHNNYGQFGDGTTVGTSSNGHNGNHKQTATTFSSQSF